MTVDDLARLIKDPAIEFRPDLRWWLAEGLHTDETLRHKIDTAYRLGFGGMEFLAMDEGNIDHARYGSLAVVLAITVLNGVAEELYFRGALYAALPSHAIGVTTILYTLTTVGSGVPLLVPAAAVVGVVTALQRRVTGGILGPVITHITWSTGMLLLLPPVLDLVR